MSSRIPDLFRDALLIVVSAVPLALCFLPLGVGYLAWVAMVPLFLALNDKSPIAGFALAWVWGLIFYPIVGHWIFEVKGYSVLHHALVESYFGFYFALFGLFYAFISKRWDTEAALLASPSIWVTLEYARSNFSFMALPGGLLAHTQYLYPVTLQIASITGAYGVRIGQCSPCGRHPSFQAPGRAVT